MKSTAENSNLFIYFVLVYAYPYLPFQQRSVIFRVVFSGVTSATLPVGSRMTCFRVVTLVLRVRLNPLE